LIIKYRKTLNQFNCKNRLWNLIRNTPHQKISFIITTIPFIIDLPFICNVGQSTNNAPTFIVFIHLKVIPRPPCPQNKPNLSSFFSKWVWIFMLVILQLFALLVNAWRKLRIFLVHYSKLVSIESFVHDAQLNITYYRSN